MGRIVGMVQLAIISRGSNRFGMLNPDVFQKVDRISVIDTEAKEYTGLRE